MKKVLAFTLVLVLALSLLTACGGNSNTPSGGDPTGSGDPTSTPGTSQGADSTPGGDPNGGSNFKYSREYVDKNLTGDFHIIYEYEDNGGKQVWTGIRTKDGFYFKMDIEEILCIKKGDVYVCYEHGDYEDSDEMTLDEINEWAEYFWDLMVGYDNGATDADEFKIAGAEKIAGRDCEKFTYEGEALNIEFWIDKTTGVCLKGKQEFSGNTISFECTTFKTSGVTLPKPN